MNQSAFIAKLTSLETTSPSVYRGAMKALKAADKEPTFAGARWELMGATEGVVFTFRLGSAEINRYMTERCLSGLGEDLVDLVDHAVSVLKKQRALQTIGGIK